MVIADTSRVAEAAVEEEEDAIETAEETEEDGG